MTTQEKLNDILKFKRRVDKIVNYLGARQKRKLYNLEEKYNVVISIHTHYKKLTFSVLKNYLNPSIKYSLNEYDIFVDETISDIDEKEILSSIYNILLKN